MPQPVEATSETQEVQTTETTSTDTAKPKDPWEGLPDEWSWTKNAVEAANREAAARRVALNELKEATKDAKTPEEFDAAVKAHETKQTALEAELARERAARKHNLDDDVLEFLTGTTEEQIEAQAAKLASLKPAAQGTTVVITGNQPSGGADPSVKPTATSGRAEWEAYKAKNSRR